MKKILIGLGLMTLAVSLNAAVLATNLAVGGVHLLSTSAANVYSIELSSDKAATVEFFDCEQLTAPAYGTNYTNAAYVSRTTYATNYVTSMVGFNGMTNFYTNAGLWTVTTTNAANTNRLPTMIAGTIGANQSKVILTDAMFTRGITVKVSTNVDLVLNYRPGQ